MKKDLYFVAVKVFLRNKDKHLLINKDVFGDWDIPGGRLRENDFNTPLENVVTRKIKEEFGEIEYNLGKPVVFMRHERNEILANDDREKRKIFAIGYDAKYLSGKISLGKNHEKYEWVNLNNFKPEEYFTGGWLKGINDYIDMISKYDL